MNPIDVIRGEAKHPRATESFPQGAPGWEGMSPEDYEADFHSNEQSIYEWFGTGDSLPILEYLLEQKLMARKFIDEEQALLALAHAKHQDNSEVGKASLIVVVNIMMKAYGSSPSDQAMKTILERGLQERLK